MELSALQIAHTASWVGTGLGFGLWLWGWLREKAPIAKLRFQDSGAVLLFASILLRIAIQTKPLSAWDWAMVGLGPLFILAALWRLTRTQGTGTDQRPGPGEPGS
jgi:hypothetical protein